MKDIITDLIDIIIIKKKKKLQIKKAKMI